MADDAEDKEQKTEAPSHKRLEEAYKRGQVPFSREITSFLLLGVLALTIATYAPIASKMLYQQLVMYLEQPDLILVDRAGVGRLMLHALLGLAAVVAVPAGLAAVASILSSLVQNGVRLTASPLAPKLEKVSFRKGLERMFSAKSVGEFLKGLFKIIVVGYVCWYAIADDMGHLKQMVDDGMLAMLLYLLKEASKLMIYVCVAMFFIALGDLIWQRFSFIKSLRMSKQELKEEHKQQEGNPEIKQRLRRLRMERARQRMMAEVPKADVVITNPTHFAVALKYDGASMNAPKVVAKGMDNMALQMRKIAAENDVTIVENKPLARALYDAAEVDEEIPMQHYQAVAEVISYVFRLKGKLPPEARPATRL